jgi:hypothetical protein
MTYSSGLNGICPRNLRPERGKGKGNFCSALIALSDYRIAKAG